MLINPLSDGWCKVILQFRKCLSPWCWSLIVEIWVRQPCPANSQLSIESGVFVEGDHSLKSNNGLKHHDLGVVWKYVQTLCPPWASHEVCYNTTIDLTCDLDAKIEGRRQIVNYSGNQVSMQWPPFRLLCRIQLDQLQGVLSLALDWVEDPSKWPLMRAVGIWSEGLSRWFWNMVSDGLSRRGSWSLIVPFKSYW